jgi:hypothetical protein
MKMIVTIAALLSLQSCFTAKQRVKYFSKHLDELRKKYNTEDFIEYRLNPADAKLLSGKPVKKMKKREINRTLLYHEKIYALLPDSVSFMPNQTIIDSFYSNMNKIEFIKEHKLQSSSIYFVRYH